MYPYPSSLELRVLCEERVASALHGYQHISSMQRSRPVLRSFAKVLGRTLVMFGHQLEHLGQ
jgi:hypothetical protein